MKNRIHDLLHAISLMKSAICSTAIALLILLCSTESAFCNRQDDENFQEYSRWAGRILFQEAEFGRPGHEDYITAIRYLKNVINRSTFEIERKDGEANPLHLAAIEGLDEIVDLLLKKGMSPFVGSHNGKTAVELAIQFDDEHGHSGYRQSEILLLEKMISILSDGNPGAERIILTLFESKDNDITISVCKKLYSKKLIGPKIWELYKDVMDSNLDKFIENILN